MMVKMLQTLQEDVNQIKTTLYGNQEELCDIRRMETIEEFREIEASLIQGRNFKNKLVSEMCI